MSLIYLHPNACIWLWHFSALTLDMLQLLFLCHLSRHKYSVTLITDYWVFFFFFHRHISQTELKWYSWSEGINHNNNSNKIIIIINRGSICVVSATGVCKTIPSIAVLLARSIYISDSEFPFSFFTSWLIIFSLINWLTGFSNTWKRMPEKNFVCWS